MELEVLDRYGRAAQRAEAALCVPTADYDPELLRSLPREVVEKDYGCGDPSRWVGDGEVVVDLGSGSGKICYILAQKVGPKGRVIGLDFNDQMLAVARKYQEEVKRKLGWDNVRFHKAKIQDMQLDLERAQRWLEGHPITSVEGLSEYEAYCQRLREEEPLIADGTVDVVVSNCVLNLVRPEDKVRLFAEIHRVLRVGGRAVISDIVCDEDPTPAILNDPGLWSGCIAGAFREDRFLEMFEGAGFYGVEVLSRSREPWQVVDGIEFRSMTVRAYKGKGGPCVDRKQAVIYRGPWKQVRDDEGHVLVRGQRMAVCDRTYGVMTDPAGPYAGQVIGVPPVGEVPADEAGAFDCRGAVVRRPREIKGEGYRVTRLQEAGGCCEPGGCG